MNRHLRLIYLLIALVACQSVWGLMDEHSAGGDLASASIELRHDGHDADADGGPHQDDSKGCLHCCHCHFHQVSFIPPSQEPLGLMPYRVPVTGRTQALPEGHPADLFKPPIT